MNDLIIEAEVGGRSFSFKPGRLNIVRGPNGSGKTTLLNALALRSMDRFKGNIKREGHAQPMDIAYLPQGIWDIDDVALDGFLQLCSRGHIRSGPKDYWEKYYRRYIPRNLDGLSGGERRLLLFLSVAAQEQKVHIYDEPFQFLDDLARETVEGMLMELVREGRLVIVVAHAKDMTEDLVLREQMFILS